MDSIKDLILELQELNARVSVEENNLKIDAPRGTIDDRLKSLIKTHKNELIDYINKARRKDQGTIPLTIAQPDYPLSFSQYRLWMINQMGLGKTAYNMYGVYRFEEDIDLPLFKAAVRKLIDRHEILRTVFIENKGVPRQKLIDSEELTIAIDCLDLSGEKNDRSELAAHKKEIFNQEFALDNWPLFRICLVKEKGRSELIFSMHHIISDGWSLEIFIRDILAIYRSEPVGGTPLLPELRIQYKDYSHWQNKLLLNKKMANQEQYWLAQLGGELPELQLPYDYESYTGMQDNRAGSFELMIDGALKSRLDEFLLARKTSLFALMVACFKILLNRLTGETDIIIGTPVANRDHEDIKDLIGFFLNTLMLRDQLEKDKPFDHFLEKVNNTILNGLENQSYPFERLLDILDVKRDYIHFPISPVFLNMLNFTSADSPEDRSDRKEEIFSVIFDLECYFREYTGGLSISCTYKAGLFKAETIEYWMHEFVSIIRQAVTMPSITVNNITAFRKPPFQIFVPQPVQPFIPFQAADIDQSIIARFEEQVRNYPDHTAVSQGNTRWTYLELNALANGLAEKILAVSGSAGANIALLLDHGINAIIGMLGVLKSANAYVPLDPNHPVDRIRYMLEDTDCPLIIASDETIDLARTFSLSGIVIVNISREISPRQKNTDILISPLDKAYILYTSGSTGQPKGVIQIHRNVLHYIRVYTNNLHIDQTDKLSLFASYTFDASVLGIYGALSKGACLYPYDLKQDGLNALPDWVIANGITLIHMVPTIYRYFIAELKEHRFDHIRLVALGGEATYRSDFEKFKQHFLPGTIFINNYGPTEASTVLQKLLDHNSQLSIRNIPLGFPVQDTQVYLLDEDNQQAGLYQVGELVFKSDYLSLGYLNKEEQTSAAFITDPVTGQGIVYRSGDFARMLPTGEIEFAGRRDTQIKWNGQRLELSEIEQNMLKIEGVLEVIVLIKAVKDQDRLVAYVRSETVIEEKLIRQKLSGVLPSYMIPGIYMFIEKFPLTPSGKISRLDLPEPAPEDLKNIQYLAPRNETEAKLVSIWEDILGRGEIGVRDDFFEAGGHSLTMTRLASQIHKIFEVRISLKELFAKKILEEQALLIGQARKTGFTAIVPIALKTDYVLSSAQRRIWMLSQFEEEGNVAYNISGAFRMEGTLDASVLSDCFGTLLSRHEILRTVFQPDEQGEIRQFVLPPQQTAFRFVIRDLRQQTEPEQQVRDLLREAVAQPFDLSAGPLIRAELYRLSDHQWILLYVLHHIISDGWSMAILSRELLELYNARTQGQPDDLAPLRIQYKDYAWWQQQQLQGETLAGHQQYWLRQLEKDLPVLALPTDKPRPAIKTYHGGTVGKRIGPVLHRGLGELSREQGGTLFMGLLATVNVLLHRYTGQQDIIIGSPIAGREHADLEEQIGFYVNVLALRTRFSAADNFQALMEHIKRITLEAYEHQSYPFDQLVQELPLDRDRSRSPLFDVFIDFHDTRIDAATKDRRLGGLQVSAYEPEEQVISKFDLTFMFTESDEGLHLLLEYNSDIYAKQTIERMIVHFEGLLQAILSAPDKAIGRLEFLDKAERDRLLEQFNAASFNGSPFNGASFNAGSFNDTRYESPLVLFEAQAGRTPDRIAVRFGDTTLTYRELNTQSARLAHYLRERYTIRTDELIGIMADRSEKLLIALLGIWKAGGAYVPIDPAYPAARKKYIIRDSGLKILLTQTEYIFDLDYYEGEVFALDAQLDGLGLSHPFNNTPPRPGRPQPQPAGLRPQPGKGPLRNTAPPVRPDLAPQSGALAYVLYTSGSTGEPKGCAITHGNLSHYIQWANNYYFDEAAAPHFGLYTSLSFDLTVTSIFCCLTLGGRLYVYGQQEELTAILRHSFSAQSGIDSIKLTPSHINLLGQLSIGSTTMLRAITGGEQVTGGQVSILKKINPALSVYNEYGPTEATVGCVVKKLQENEPVRIGRPIAGTSICITNGQDLLCPIGVVGEIGIGGPGLAKGYLHKPSLTAEKFTGHPFKAGERLYRTGDLGRWLADGEIEFIGRRDEQVKIRGYRIEPGEIESALQSHPSIAAAVVIARPGKGGEQELVAYLESQEALQATDIRAYLVGLLPAYMLPAHFVRLAQLPLTPNGKIDRRRLPDPEGLSLATGTPYLAPRNELERKMVTIWQKILEKENIGIQDNFFDLGGDSMKILRVIAEIRKELDMEMPVSLIYKNNTIERIVADFFKNQTTIEDQNNLLKENEIRVRKEIQALKDRILSAVNLPEKENIEDIYPMSDIEKGMLFGSLLNEGTAVYHDQFLFQQTFAGFEPERLDQALQLMADKHSILRTSFNVEDYETEVQIVHKKIKTAVSFQDLSDLTREEQERRTEAYMRKELENTFRISEAPLWRMSVFSLGNNEWAFLWQFHHAILDGWSTASFITELNNLYLALATDRLYRPEKLQSGYKDFIVRHLMEQQDRSTALFWQQELSDNTRLDLFTDKNEFKRYSAELDESHIRKLERLSAELNTTVKTLSFCAYLYMLKVLNYGNDIIAGLVTNNRPDHEDSDKVLGCFLNTIPVRMLIDGHERGVDFITRVNDKLIALKDKEKFSLSAISLINNERQEEGNPFFDVFFNYIDFYVYQGIKNEPAAQQKNTAGSAVQLEGSRELTNTYFDCTVSMTGGKYTLSLRLTKTLKSGLSVERIGALYFDILTYLADFPGQPLHQLDYLRAEEKQQLLGAFNNTAAIYPKDSTVINLLEEQVNRTPDAPAIEFQGAAMTYSQLNGNANQLSDYLRRDAGIQPDDLVGILLDRSEWMVVALLGVLKSGAAYVPIDPGYPQERIDYILADSKCKMIIDAGKLAGFIKYRQHYSKDNVKDLNRPDSLAYVIYTSGSTGLPKGVMIGHRSVCAFISWCKDEFRHSIFDAVLGVTSICFDLSVFEILYTLSSGKKLIILTDALAIPEHLNTSAGILLNTVPSVVGALLNAHTDLSAVKVLNMAGEPIPAGYVSRLDCSMTEVRNLYGPSEATTYSTVYRIHKDGPILIGRPIANTVIYILSEEETLQPAGVEGEIVISGAGLALGYLNQPGLTAEKFVANPFSPGELMYKTGDIGRWLPDGNLAFIGRVDEQVKIRGYRIELAEIEKALQKYPSIGSAIVLAKSTQNGEKELVAYLTGKNPLSIQDIRTHLAKTLPGYMLPAFYITLDALPLTPSGKVDKRRLPDPGQLNIHGDKEYLAPRNETEAKLVSIWEDILGRGEIGVRDDFFEVGGHSLTMTRLASQIHKIFEVRISLKELFAKKILEEQALLIGQARKSNFHAIAAIQPQAHYMLSSAQRRLFVLSQFGEGNIAYNISGAFRMEGTLDASVLSDCFGTLLSRHEILRTVFQPDEQGEIRQFVLPPQQTAFRFVIRDLRQQTEPEQQVRDLLREAVAQPFDLSAGPLIRAELYRLSDHQWILLYVLHHIISDGWSMAILSRELLELYNARTQGQPDDLAPLRIQYKDYAWWQQQQLQGETLAGHQQYWLRQLEKDLPVLALPTDKPRPAIKTYHGGTVGKRIGPVLHRGLGELSREQGGTLFMGLLATVNVLLHRYTGQQDIIIGSPIAGREHADLEEQIGFYVNVLALRTRFSAADNFQALMEHIKRITLEAYEHQSYPFDQLVQELPLDRDRSRSPLFDVFIDFHDTRIDAATKDRRLGGLQVSAYEPEEQVISKFDLTFMFTESDEGLHLLLEYNSDIYAKQTIERMIVHFEGLLQAILSAPDKAIGRLEFLDKAERDRLLEQFNAASFNGSPFNGASFNAGSFNDTRYESPLVLFEAQAGRTPDRIAVRFGDTTLTYRELNTQSARLAHYLRERYTIRTDELIGIMADRSEKLLIALLGIWKAGGAYVPIDPAYPAARKKYIIRDSGLKILLTQTEYIFDLDYYEGEVFALDAQLDGLGLSHPFNNTPPRPGRPQPQPAGLRPQPGKGPLRNTAPPVRPDLAPQSGALAYVLYTSGSTGEPKGCAITHGNLSHYIQWANNYYFDEAAAPHFGLYTSLSFDLTVTSIFCCLTLGGRLYVYGQQEELTAILRHSFSAQSGIDSIKLTPSHINLLGQLSIGSTTMLRAITGGEQVTGGQVSILKKINPALSVYNEYGPTEATVGCVVKKLQENEPVRIGRPIAGTSICITNGQDLLCPIGVVGEIGIGGPGLAKGYLHKPSLTAEKFTGHPFKAGERLYKTGDLGRWLVDGEIEFIGRRDEQVKIRGYRIEPGEIESALQSHPSIAAAVVIARPGKGGEQELVAYLESREALQAADIRAYLAGLLPAYMLPAHFVRLAQLPLTPNGKIDRRRLPDPEGLSLATGTSYLAPRNELERKMVTIWQEILGVQKIGIKDDFFDLGGHSLKATSLLARIKKEFAIEVTITDFFMEPSIEALADKIDNDRWLQTSLGEEEGIYSEIKI